jgi:hypothetical protein
LVGSESNVILPDAGAMRLGSDGLDDLKTQASDKAERFLFQ